MVPSALNSIAFTFGSVFADSRVVLYVFMNFVSAICTVHAPKLISISAARKAARAHTLEPVRGVPSENDEKLGCSLLSYRSAMLEFFPYRSVAVNKCVSVGVSDHCTDSTM